MNKFELENMEAANLQTLLNKHYVNARPTYPGGLYQWAFNALTTPTIFTIGDTVRYVGDDDNQRIHHVITKVGITSDGVCYGTQYGRTFMRDELMFEHHANEQTLKLLIGE